MDHVLERRLQREVLTGGQPVIWTNPDELAYDPKKPVPRVGGIFETAYNALMCDGSVKFLPRSLAYFTEVIRMLKDNGCDAVVLGCTEIPLLVTPDSSPLPVLDSTRLLARAALRKAVG